MAGLSKLTAVAIKAAAVGAKLRDGGGLTLERGDAGDIRGPQANPARRRQTRPMALALHVLPKIGSIRVSKLHQRDIHDAIAPIWRTKHETADKALYRTRMVLQHARLSGHDVDPFLGDAARHMLG